MDNHKTQCRNIEKKKEEKKKTNPNCSRLAGPARHRASNWLQKSITIHENCTSPCIFLLANDANSRWNSGICIYTAHIRACIITNQRRDMSYRSMVGLPAIHDHAGVSLRGAVSDGLCLCVSGP